MAIGIRAPRRKIIVEVDASAPKFKFIVEELVERGLDVTTEDPLSGLVIGSAEEDRIGFLRAAAGVKNITLSEKAHAMPVMPLPDRPKTRASAPQARRSSPRLTKSGRPYPSILDEL